MAKSSKKSKAASALAVPQIAPQSETRNGSDLSHSGLLEPKGKASKTAKATQGSKAAVKVPGSSSGKPAVRRKTGAGKSAKPSGKSGMSVSDDEIRLRAYFISEHRMRKGLPGDSGHDWLEARRQLMAEAESRA
jgi:hypothetical protein